MFLLMYLKSKVVAAPGCPQGGVYQTLSKPKTRCHCWGKCGYVCQPSKGNGNGK